MLSCSVVALLSSLLGLVGLAGLGHHYYHHGRPHDIFQGEEVKDWSHDHHLHGHSMEAMKQILGWGWSFGLRNIVGLKFLKLIDSFCFFSPSMSILKFLQENNRTYTTPKKSKDTTFVPTKWPTEICASRKGPSWPFFSPSKKDVLESLRPKLWDLRGNLPRPRMATDLTLSLYWYLPAYLVFIIKIMWVVCSSSF